jgi:hypothetical protein
MNSPPLLVSFSSVEDYLHSLTNALTDAYGEQIKGLVSQNYPPVVSLQCLATLFGYSSRFVGSLHRRTDHYYRTFQISKGRGYRTIHAPKVALKVIQKWIGCHLAKVVAFDECVFGFVPGRSAPQAAATHCRANWVCSFDIKDFFSSTPIASVVKSLEQQGYPPYGAQIMGKLCSYNECLAQGSPASPVLSNLVFRETDKALKHIASKNGIKYTRYADDLVFSGVDDFPNGLKEDVAKLIQSAGWRLADEKHQLIRRPARLKVHGLLIDGEYPRLTKGYRNRIRAFKHLLEGDKVAEEDIPRLKGHLAYARSVERLNPSKNEGSALET